MARPLDGIQEGDGRGAQHHKRRHRLTTAHGCRDHEGKNDVLEGMMRARWAEHLAKHHVGRENSAAHQSAGL